MDYVQNADGVPLLRCEKMFEVYKGIFLPSLLSYDHLASVMRKVLEEKPENVAGKFLICTIRFCILTTFFWYMYGLKCLVEMTLKAKIFVYY